LAACTNAALYSIVEQVVTGMTHLHSRTTTRDGRPWPVLHLALQPSNVLLRRDGESSWTAKVANMLIDSSALDVNTLRTTESPYLAPELGDRERIGRPADLYSFGVLLWVILSKDLNAIPIPSATLENQSDPMPHADRLEDMARLCLSPAVAERPTFEDIQQQLRFLNADGGCGCEVEDRGRAIPSNLVWDGRKPICVTSTPSHSLDPATGKYSKSAMGVVLGMNKITPNVLIGFDFAASQNSRVEDGPYWAELATVPGSDLDSKDAVLKKTQWWTLYEQQVVSCACRFSLSLFVCGIASSECLRCRSVALKPLARCTPTTVVISSVSLAGQSAKLRARI